MLIIRGPIKLGGGDLRNFFKAGTILQVDSAVVIYEIMGCKEIFRNFLRFNPPPTPSNFRKMG